MNHPPRYREQKRCLVLFAWTFSSPFSVFMATSLAGDKDALDLDLKPRLCIIQLCLTGIGGSDGASAFALFHRGGGGRQLYQCSRAAAAHSSAIPEPANSRS